ncbi:hypothetical protein [Solidesulfovibrio sp.]|uniref:hypothetical protein n=1 Tax=Solidesulfovibrio sp. TaxID=2910990 RepID=UPI002602D18F|nr:hypothetical protein [Solidesulfovibrio sp.]
MRTDTDDHAQAPVPSWPEAMERGRVSDAAFARAYGRVGDLGRARIKTGVAAIFAACGGPMPLARRSETVLGHDLVLTREDVPLDFVVIVCGPGFASPARLAAAVLPALCARTPEVAAVRLGGPWPEALLTALELCGVETACRVGPRGLTSLWAGLAAKGQGAAVLLDGAPRPAGDLAGRLVVHEAKVAGRVLVRQAADPVLDRDALAFAQPDLAIIEASDAPGAPDALARTADSGYDAVYGDPADGRQGQDVPLILGPGRETFWLWPHLSPEAFRRRRAAAFRRGDDA